MTILILCIAAVCAYLVSGLNPAIILSKSIYHKDIRECGSGNPGFTNLKRTFGNKWAWWVFVLDLGKAAAVVALFAFLYSRFGGDYQFGAAFTGLFAMAGHAFPVWYGFKGGKGFLVYMSIIWFVSWRAGLVAAAVLVVLLLFIALPVFFYAPSYTIRPLPRGRSCYDNPLRRSGAVHHLQAQRKYRASR